jgi:hypothetical protein
LFLLLQTPPDLSVGSPKTTLQWEDTRFGAWWFC